MSAPPERLKLAPGVQVMLSAMLPRHTWDRHTRMPEKKMLVKLGVGWRPHQPNRLIYDWYIPATGSVNEQAWHWQNFPWFFSAKPFWDARFWQQ